MHSRGDKPLEKHVLNYNRVFFWIACHVKVFCAHLLPKTGLWHLNASWRECGVLEFTRRTSVFLSLERCRLFHRRIALLQVCLVIPCKLAVIVGIKIQESTSAAPVPICQRKRCAVICWYGVVITFPIKSLNVKVSNVGRIHAAMLLGN